MKSFAPTDVLAAIQDSPADYRPDTLATQAVATVRTELFTSTLVQLGSSILSSPNVCDERHGLQPPSPFHVRVARVLVYQRGERCEVLLIGEQCTLYPDITNIHADIALAVAASGTGDYTLSCFPDPDCRREVVRCQRTPRGWNMSSIAPYVDDVLVDEGGEFTVLRSQPECGPDDGVGTRSWATQMTAEEFFDRLDTHRVVVDERNGFRVENGTLVRVLDPDDVVPAISVRRDTDGRVFRYSFDADIGVTVSRSYHFDNFPASPATLGRPSRCDPGPSFGSAVNTSSALQTSV